MRHMTSAFVVCCCATTLTSNGGRSAGKRGCSRNRGSHVSKVSLRTCHKSLAKTTLRQLTSACNMSLFKQL